jgi:hypothetical protein
MGAQKLQLQLTVGTRVLVKKALDLAAAFKFRESAPRCRRPHHSNGYAVLELGKRDITILRPHAVCGNRFTGQDWIDLSLTDVPGNDNAEAFEVLLPT